MEENRAKYGQLSGIIGIFCNILLAVSKLVVGLVSGMISIIADSVNNFSDAASSIISLVAFKISTRPADDEHPFGHARIEYISGLAVAFIVMVAGFELFKESIRKIIEPSEIAFSGVMFVVLGLSIAVKLGMAVFNYRLGRKIKSTVVLATAADSRNDVIATSTVLAATFISYFTGKNLDGIMGLLVALFVLYSGIGLIHDTIKPLLGTTPDDDLVENIETKIMGYEGVIGTHDLMVHDYGPGHCFASVHVEVPAERNILESHELIDRIEQDFLNDCEIQLVIHYDPIVTSDEAVKTIRHYLKDCAKDIWEGLSIHDLRIVPGEANTNVIFDCVVPNSCPVKEERICDLLKDKLREEYPNHTAVIKVDHGYVSLNTSKKK